MRLRTELLLLGLLIGPVLLVTGCLATFVAIADPPAQDGEQAAVTAVGLLGLVGGVGFTSLALPERWGAPRWLWRHLGWLAPLSLVPLALMMLVFSDEVARDAYHWRARTPAGVLVYGVGLLVVAGVLVRAWWHTRASRRR